MRYPPFQFIFTFIRPYLGSFSRAQKSLNNCFYHLNLCIVLLLLLLLLKNSCLPYRYDSPMEKRESVYDCASRSPFVPLSFSHHETIRSNQKRRSWALRQRKQSTSAVPQRESVAPFMYIM